MDSECSSRDEFTTGFNPRMWRFLGLSAPRIGAIVTRKLPRLSALAWKHYSIGLIVKVITNFNKSLLLINRGQESCGVVTSEGNNEFHIHKGMGLVKNVFNKDNISKLKGSLGIGHTRYTTRAASSSVNCQPFVVHSMHGSLATAHNGQLVNCSSLRKRVLDRGVGLSTHSDSEIITQALCLIPPRRRGERSRLACENPTSDAASPSELLCGFDVERSNLRD
jgi:glutamate synthase domain-containing protein 1